MSNIALSWAFKCHVGNASAKAVLLDLADRAQEDGSCAWPDVVKVRVATDLSERTVRAALKALQERGLIVPRETGLRLNMRNETGDRR